MGKVLSIKDVETRIKEIERDISIVDWNGSKKPCTYKCNKCGRVSQVKEGYYVYTKNSKYFKWIDCMCKNNKGINNSYESIKKDGEIIDKSIDSVKDVLKEHIGQPILRADLVKKVTAKLGVECMSPINFNYAILLRVCSFKEICASKGNELWYLIEEIYEETLPKTDYRIELEKKASEKIQERLLAQ